MTREDEIRRRLSRRNLLRGAGALGVGAMLPLDRLTAATGKIRIDQIAERMVAPAAVAPLPAEARLVLQGSCTLTPAQTEGPYYVNANLVRQDIREGRVVLHTILYYQVVRASDCSPVQGAAVDVWHADAGGVYSGVAQQGTTGQRFLRGIQITDANGLVRFDTIYPGYYPGRTAHIHVKVHPTSGQTLTTQSYFPDPITDLVYQLVPPYSSRPARQTRNPNDGIYRAQNEKPVIANPDASPSVLTGLQLVIP